jgi:amidase
MTSMESGTQESAMDRRTFVVAGVALGALAVAGAAAHTPLAWGETPPPRPRTDDDFALAEATIDQLQAGMQSGKYTSRSIVEQYLARIDALDQRGPAINAIIELNPDALAIADALDAERKSKGPRGPMHGIPVLLKDNIATHDKMQTTAGSLALVGGTPQRDAFIAERLRAAGAVILGKTNLSEWANFRSTHSSSGWSGRGGQTRNPYALDRTPSGSSAGSGSAIAANLCAVAVGTETDGSVVSPSSCNGLVGVKPTVGLLSRAGIVPISHTQDTPGPMTRTVRDAAILLGAMTGVDARDPVTSESAGRTAKNYTEGLVPGGLRGARLGVVRTKLFGYSRHTDQVIEDALKVLSSAGAVLVDPANITTLGEFDDAEQLVMLYEIKADLFRYLTDLGAAAPIHTLADAIAYNNAHRDAEMPFFGQELFEQAEKKGPLTESAYVKALDRCRRLSRAEGIDRTMTTHRVDALVAPTNGPAGLIDLVNGDSGGGGSSTPAAVAGYPHVTVPAGFALGLPIGLSFFGRPYTEALLLKFAYAYEQASKMRKPPEFKPTVTIGDTRRTARG